jgi:hypothetical protein
MGKMKNEKIKKIDQFSAHMDKMDDYFFEGEIPTVSVFLIYGGKRLELTFCPEVMEKLQEAIAAEKEYWGED